MARVTRAAAAALAVTALHATVGAASHDAAPHSSAIAAAAPLPHIVMVVIDDWGWNDVGWHARNQNNSNEIQTPHIDALAAAGVILDRHYVHQFCSPSRSALHTGRHPIHVNS